MITIIKTASGNFYHIVMAVFWTLAMLFSLLFLRGNTAPTYYYCWHLDQVSFFRNQFRRSLHLPGAMEAWSRPRTFIDDMPDIEVLSNLPAGSLGAVFADFCHVMKIKGFRQLRDRRFKTLPEERDGLELAVLKGTTDPDERYRLIVARRNIFMTSSHDFVHLLLGAPPNLGGEILVAGYQYHHLMVPQNWLNVINCSLLLILTLRWVELVTVYRKFPAIRRSENYARIDFSDLWDRPLGEARQVLNLPPEGLLKGDLFAGTNSGEGVAA